MKRLILVLIMLVLAASPAWSGDFPKVKGWKAAGKVRTYEPGSLWKIINGAAELFLAYDFQHLKVQDLSRKGLVVTVNIYDMGNALNAFGIYMTERPKTVDVIAVGGEAYLSLPYQCLLLKDRYYVKVEAYEGEISREAGENLLKALAGALEGRDGPPESLNRLPLANRIKGSERYVREAYLGLSALRNCLIADYRFDDGPDLQAFYLFLPGGKDHNDLAKTVFIKWKRLRDGSRNILFRKVPYRGLAGMMVVEGGFLGVSGAEDEDRLKTWLCKVADSY